MADGTRRGPEGVGYAAGRADQREEDQALIGRAYADGFARGSERCYAAVIIDLREEGPPGAADMVEKWADALGLDVPTLIADFERTMADVRAEDMEQR